MLQENEILLKCRNLTLKRKGFTLDSVDFELPKGYILGIMGRNGVGKSTLVQALLGICQKEEQERIFFQGTPIKDIVSYKKNLAFVLNENTFPEKLNSLDCGVLYQEYYDNFDQSGYLQRLKAFEVPERVCIKKLSKGQKIRQQLAFALSHDACLYIFDEPTGNLDREFRERFWEEVQKLTRDGEKSVIYVSHLVEELERMADYLLWIWEKDGEGEEKGAAQKYFGTTERLLERFQLIQASGEEAEVLPEGSVAGIRDREYAKEFLAYARREELPENLREVSRYPTLKEIMYYVEKSGFADLDGK